MARLPNLAREDLKPEDQKHVDAIVGTRGGIRGPFGVLLHSPDLASRVAATGAYVRFEGEIPNALREVAILVTGREIKNQYEFSAHARLAREAGVSEETIQAIVQGEDPDGLAGDEQIVARYARELVRDHGVADATYQAVEGRFGVQGTVDLTVLIGHYVLVGMVLSAFQVDLLPGMQPELPL